LKELLKYLSVALLSIVSLALFILLFKFEEVLSIVFKENNRTIKIVDVTPMQSAENKKLIEDLQKAITDVDTELNKEEAISQKMLSEVEDYELSKSSTPPAPKEIVLYKEDIEADNIAKHIPKPKPKIVSKGGKPKVVIIIDDIISQRQVDSLNAIGLNLTLSFLPPTDAHPNSAIIAKNQPSHMVHLPLEAMSFYKKEGEILKTTSTREDIDRRIKTLRDIYPHAKYLNNHTGSKFTADFVSMQMLITTLSKYNFTFVDSRTTKYTKAIATSKKLGIDIHSRDVFLDNKLEVAYIHKQIKTLIKKSKHQGYAIAIAHPHPVTIKALKLAKKSKLLNDIEIIHIEKLI
jgi:polysaccharide deacetylase 2 family uncharacterized protein YibQ